MKKSMPKQTKRKKSSWMSKYPVFSKYKKDKFYIRGSITDKVEYMNSAVRRNRGSRGMASGLKRAYYEMNKEV